MNQEAANDVPILPDARQRLLYRFIRAAFAVLAFIPRSWISALGAGASRLWYRFDRRHREVALENLAKAYPERDAAWVEKTARAVFRHFSVMMLEMPHMVKVHGKNARRYLTATGLSNMESAMKSGRGVLLMSAHLGNWELLGHTVSLFTRSPVLIITRTLDNPALNKVVWEWRANLGNIPIPKEKSAMRILDYLARGGVVGILLDQNAAWFEGVFVTFFNRKACTAKGLAKLALATGSPVVPVMSIRQPDGRYRISCGKPIEMIRTGNEADDIEVNTLRFNMAMEEYIREAPDQWLWIHRRWRVLPIPPEARAKIRHPPD